jgi:ATP-dependent DNA ligase
MPDLAHLPMPTSIATMEAKLVDAIPAEPGWRFEPKWDGFRCLAFRAGDEVVLHAKSGKPLGRYFPEVVARLRVLPVDRFVVDGELVIEQGGQLAFDALQMRLHPAESRITKLARETPADFVLFDCLLGLDGESLVGAPFTQRRKALEALFKAFKKAKGLRLSPGTTDRNEACEWLMAAGDGLDGVVAKRLDGPYVPGERAMLKIKRMRTVDCVVGGFRYATGTKFVGSLLLGLYDGAGKLNHVGFTSTITHAERPELTARLEKLRGEGFTGEAPGGPSRWSTDRSAEWVPLRPELVVEVRYDHMTGGRFRHGTRLLRWRPDKRPDQCTYDQLESGAGAALAALRG